MMNTPKERYKSIMVTRPQTRFRNILPSPLKSPYKKPYIIAADISASPNHANAFMGFILTPPTLLPYYYSTPFQAKQKLDYMKFIKIILVTFKVIRLVGVSKNKKAAKQDSPCLTAYIMFDYILSI